MAMSLLSAGLIFALSTGVFPNEKLYKRGRIKAIIRHGDNVPVKILLRTTNKRDPKREDWEYIEEVLHFPRRVIANPNGRRITVRLPENLKKFTQLCSLYQPGIDRSAAAGFRVAFSLESCANVYQPE